MAKRDEPVSALSLLARLEREAGDAAGDAGAQLRYGWALYGSGDPARASVLASRAAELAPTDAEPPYLQGLALKAVGDGGGAKVAFRTALSAAAGLGDTSRGSMLRRLAIGHLNWLEKGTWDLEPEMWVRT